MSSISLLVRGGLLITLFLLSSSMMLKTGIVVLERVKPSKDVQSVERHVQPKAGIFSNLVPQNLQFTGLSMTCLSFLSF